MTVIGARIGTAYTVSHVNTDLEVESAMEI